MVASITGQLGRPREAVSIMEPWFDGRTTDDLSAVHAFAALTYAQGLHFSGQPAQALAVADQWLEPLRTAHPDNPSVQALSRLAQEWRGG